MKISHSRVFVFVLVVTVLSAGSYLLAAEGNSSGEPRLSEGRGGPARYRVFSLKHISAEQAKGYLAQANILCTASQLPGADALLVTAQPPELIKASDVLKLVDTEGLQNPAPPSGLGEPNEPRPKAAEPQDANENEFLNKLLKSLAEAEQMAAKLDELPVENRKQSEADTAEKPEPEREPESAPEEASLEPGRPAEVSVPTDMVLDDEPAVTARPYEPQPITDGNEMLELDLPERLNIVDLLDLVGKYLHLDYMYDAAKVKGDVALKVQGPIKVKDLYPLLESALKFRGFVMTRKGGLVTIVPAAEALSIDPALLDADKAELRYGDVIVTRIFELKHIDTASAANLLSSMKLGANITPIAGTGTLIVTGYAYRMTRIEELLEMVDRPGEPKQFRFRQLKYTMAKTLAPKVKTLAEQLGTVSITVTAPSPSITRKRGESTSAFRKRQTAASKRVQAQKKAAPGEAAVYLDADERTNRILMIGLEEQLAVVDELIDTLDVAQQDLRALRLYEIQHVGAEEVLKKLSELGIIGAGRATTAAPAGAKSAKPPRPAPEGPLVEQPQVIIIESTNSLLVNATAEQHARIAQIISYVDSETLEQAIPYEIYSLENQNPEDLAEVLQKLIAETIKDKEGKIEKVIKKQEDIVIVPDKSTFSIIVYASRKNQEWIGKLIEKLDKRRPQVLIDVALVEVTREDLFEYDLNLIANAKDLVTNNIVFGETSGLVTSATGNNLEGGWNMGNTGKVKGFYAEDKIQALLTAMDKKDYGRVLAQPKILVNDNETGLIKTTEKTHVGETTTTYPSQGTTGGVLNPIYTTTYKPYEARIELSITPNISEGALLRLEIDMLREDFERKEVGPPDYTTSNVNTIVTVPDGSTVILGGLTKLKQSKGGSKVPLLGDIPLIGGLFRTISNSDEASKLYIFVKANILRPDETAAGLAQLRQISEANRAAFEEAERKFQAKEDWPGIEPEPVEPLRVLEAE